MAANASKNNKKHRHRTVRGWPRPLNRGGRLIQVTNAAFHGMSENSGVAA